MSRWENKYVIGLTGNIAVGKSYIRQMLQHLGAYPIDADQLTHQAMAPGAPAYKPVVELFGKFILDEENRISRARLGQIAFAVPDALAALETVIHPAVRQAVGILVTRAQQKVIVVEAIKLLEGDLLQAVDTVWVVDAAPETQLRRLVEKRKMTPEDARRRIAAQRPQAEKLQKANVIIRNDGNVEETWKSVQAAWDDIMRVIAPPPAPVVAPPAPVTPPTPAPAPTGSAGIKPLTISSGRTSTQSVPAVAPAAAAPPVPARQPAVAPPAPIAPAPAAATVTETRPAVTIKRGMPGNAEAIATFISKSSPRQVSRMDIMIAFGQKSFLLGYGAPDSLVGVVGWQVENLITRVDEFYIAPEYARTDILGDLVTAVEDASRELQSEVSFIVVPRTTGSELGTALLRRGYKLVRMDEIRFPAWREAAQDMLQTPNVDVLIKQLRADRVMKPI